VESYLQERHGFSQELVAKSIARAQLFLRQQGFSRPLILGMGIALALITRNPDTAVRHQSGSGR
jgi:hypothetical protein